MKSFLILSLAYLLGLSSVYAQCTPAPPADITCSSGTQVTNSSGSINVNGGDNFRSCQGSTSISNANVSGGDLNVCGDLTITNLTFNSGRIIIARQGKLTISNSVTLNSNCTIANYGTLIINGNLDFQNNNNYLYNYASDAKTTISGQVSFASNSSQVGVFVNKGYATANSFLVRDGGKLCLEAGSILSLVNYSNGNNETNQVSFGSASGTANLCYSGTFTMNNGKSLTTSSNIRICRASSASPLSGSGSFGSATVVTNCTCGSAPATQTGAMTCFTTLPVHLLSFQVYLVDNQAKIEWITLNEIDVKYYEIQKSKDGQIYEPIKQIWVEKNTLERKTYTYFDEINADLLYYRLKLVNQDQSFEYLATKSIHLNNQFDLNEESIMIYPNPTRSAFSLEFLKPYKNSLLIELFNPSGIKVYTQWIQPWEKNKIFTQDFSAGVYFLKIYTQNKTIVKKIIIN